jgi:hypothetical protein
MNTDIQDIRDLQRAVVAAILAHPVRENKYSSGGPNKEDQERRFAAFTPLWQSFLKGAKNEADRLRRQRQLSKVNHHPWYLGPGAEEVAEVYFARAAELQDDRLNAEEAQTQASLQAQAEGAACVAESRKADALARLPEKERQAIAREKRLAYALQKGAVPAEKGLVHLFWQGFRADKVSIVQDRIDYRVLWVIAVCARRLLEESGETVQDLAPRQEPIFATAEELERTAAELKALSCQEASRAAPSIAFTDSDFRRILGRPELRSKKIYDIVNYLPTIIMDFTNFPGLSVLDAEGNERWIEYTNLRTNFVTIFSEKKVARKRTRGGRPGQERVLPSSGRREAGRRGIAMAGPVLLG